MSQLKTLNKRIKWNKKRPLLKDENTEEKMIGYIYDIFASVIKKHLTK